MARATSKSTVSKPRRTTTSRTAAKTVTSKTTTRKASAAKITAPKTVAKTPAVRRSAVKAPAAPAPVVVSETTPVSDQLELRKVELIEMVVERSGVKKRDAKPAIEAALDILDEALADGRELNLKPLGKIKVNRVKQLSNAQVIICKIRRGPGLNKDAKEPLAEPAE